MTKSRKEVGRNVDDHIACEAVSANVAHKCGSRVCGGRKIFVELLK